MIVHAHPCRSLALLFVMPVLLGAFFGGRVAHVVTTVLAVLAFASGFIPPVGPLRIHLSEDIAALTEVRLDIRHAKVLTLGHETVDSFYVVDTHGKKLTDPERISELERAVLFELSRLR